MANRVAMVKMSKQLLVERLFPKDTLILQIKETMGDYCVEFVVSHNALPETREGYMAPHRNIQEDLIQRSFT